MFVFCLSEIKKNSKEAEDLKSALLEEIVKDTKKGSSSAPRKPQSRGKEKIYLDFAGECGENPFVSHPIIKEI